MDLAPLTYIYLRGAMQDNVVWAWIMITSNGMLCWNWKFSYEISVFPFKEIA